MFMKVKKPCLNLYPFSNSALAYYLGGQKGLHPLLMNVLINFPMLINPENALKLFGSAGNHIDFKLPPDFPPELLLEVFKRNLM